MTAFSLTAIFGRLLVEFHSRGVPREALLVYVIQVHFEKADNLLCITLCIRTNVKIVFIQRTAIIYIAHSTLIFIIVDEWSSLSNLHHWVYSHKTISLKNLVIFSHRQPILPIGNDGNAYASWNRCEYSLKCFLEEIYLYIAILCDDFSSLAKKFYFCIVLGQKEKKKENALRNVSLINPQRILLFQIEWPSFEYVRKYFLMNCWKFFGTRVIYDFVKSVWKCSCMFVQECDLTILTQEESCRFP